ncbi:MAG: XRE family transcriptional regulator [Cytophagales bacterium]|nr:MAG: XRE family transcriptional regulator [Cytophagales bacterium]
MFEKNIVFSGLKMNPKNKSMHRIGLNIKKIRELRNYTQEYMAESLKMSQTGYSKIERGETDVTVDKINLIAKILDVNLLDLLEFDGKITVIGSVNDQATGIRNGIVIGKESFDKERQLYEEQIKMLKEEVAYLKNIIDRLSPTAK